MQNRQYVNEKAWEQIILGIVPTKICCQSMRSNNMAKYQQFLVIWVEGVQIGGMKKLE